MNGSYSFTYNLLIWIVTCQLSQQASTMVCLPNVSLRTLFPTCVQSFIFSGKDDDSFWGEEEQGPSTDSDQETPSTTILCATSEVMVYEPATSHLAYDLNNSAKTRVEADSATCQVKPISGERLRSKYFVSSLTIEDHRTTNLARQISDRSFTAKQ